ncbi:MAG: hypothetical protein GVY11_04000 [Gammaproteobacteria bacterium]|jgi:hypothetical protein|nr:hypothetical protein [Gammaproteobacteria bacterium]
MAKAMIYTVHEFEGPLNAYGTKSEALKEASKDARVLKITTKNMPLRQLIVALINSDEWQGEVEVIQEGWVAEPDDDFLDLAGDEDEDEGESLFDAGEAGWVNNLW